MSAFRSDKWAGGTLKSMLSFEREERIMARWPRTVWTTIFTYGAVFVLFPLLAWLAYLWVQGRLFPF
jgi:hypothetical protein